MTLYPSPSLFPSPSLYPGGSPPGGGGGTSGGGGGGTVPAVLEQTVFGQAMYEALEPIATGDADRGYPLALICGAFGEMFRDVEDLVRAQPGRQPWQQAFDINAAPTWLYPWLGQLVGVRDLNGLAPAAQQAKIVAEAGFYRASTSALRAAVSNTLTGSKAVRVIERASDARTITVVTGTATTPNPTLTAQVAQANKRAMLVMTVAVSDVPLFQEGTRTFAAATGTFATATIPNVT